MAIPRRKIEEIVARHKHARDIKDIFVEGIYDRDFFKSYLNKSGHCDVTVYPIDTIEVSDERLAKLGLTSGNKQRLIALAHALQESSITGAKLACVVDADFDHILEIDRNSEYLLVTDYSCLEMYFFDKELFVDLLRKTFGVADAEGVCNSLISPMENLLVDLYAFRVALHNLNLNIALIDLGKQINKNGEFDIDDYIKKTLNRSSAISQLSAVMDEFRRIKGLAARLDKRKVMHGHDFPTVLSKLLSQHKVDHILLKDGDALSRVIMSIASYDLIAEFSLFRRLESKVVT